MANKYWLSLILFFGIMMFIVSTGFVSAGVSAPYYASNPLNMAPGETKNVDFILTNGGDKEDSVVVSIKEGGHLVSITTGSSYTVPPKSNTVKLGLKISIPSDAKVGDKFDILINVQSVGEQDGAGTVQLGVSYNVKFPVVIVTEATEKIVDNVSDNQTTAENNRVDVGSVTSFVIILIIIIVIILVWWILKKNKDV